MQTEAELHIRSLLLNLKLITGTDKVYYMQVLMGAQTTDQNIVIENMQKQHSFMTKK